MKLNFYVSFKKFIDDYTVECLNRFLKTGNKEILNSLEQIKDNAMFYEGFFDSGSNEIHINLFAHYKINESFLIRSVIDTIIHESLHYTIVNESDIDDIEKIALSKHEYIVKELLK